MESIDKKQSHPSRQELKAEERLSVSAKEGQPGFFGKHRMVVAVSNVHNQIKHIQVIDLFTDNSD